jgi:uncharacterized protein (UPF0332 family)
MTEQQAELLKKAHRAVEAARLDAKAGGNDFATSHAYYACLYAAKAALLSLDLHFSSHSAVIAAFGREFAKTGLLPKRMHSILVRAFDDRQDSDYEMLPIPTSEETAGSLAAAEEFVAAVEKFLKAGGQ